MEQNGHNPDLKPYVFLCYRTYELILIAVGVFGSILLGLLLFGGYVETPWWSVAIPACMAAPFGLPALRRAWKGQWVAKSHGEFEFVIEDDAQTQPKGTHMKVQVNQQSALEYDPSIVVACGLTLFDVRQIISPVNPEQLYECSQWKGIWEASWPHFNEMDLQRLKRNRRIEILDKEFGSGSDKSAMQVRFQVFKEN